MKKSLIIWQITSPLIYQALYLVDKSTALLPPVAACKHNQPLTALAATWSSLQQF